MNNNIDQLKTEVDNIKNSLNELKDNVSLSEVEKKNQAEALKAQAETAKQKIQAEISALDTQTGVDIDRKKAEAQALLDSFNEIMDLYSSIVSPVTPNVPTVTPSAPVTTPSTPTTTPDEKWFFWKAWDWIWEQRSDVWSGDKRKEQPWSNVLRVVWFWVTWYAAYKWVKALWNRAFWDNDDKEEWDESEDEETESKTKKKKKSFWKTWVWEFLKWAGIGTAWVGIVWWLGKKIGLIHSDAMTDRAKDQAKTTQELKEKDPVKYEKYKGIWENIDSQYSQVMKKEIDAWWWGISIADGYEKYADKNNLDKDMFQATVPMCIDSEYSSVDTFLSEGGYYAYLRWLNFNELKDEILGWGKEKIWNILGPYLCWLTSFIPFKWKDWSEWLKAWFENRDAADAEAELQLFFRQYTKVVNYTQDKLWTLKAKIGAERFANAWENFSTLEDALKDKQWCEDYIYTDPRYKNFVNWKLHQAVDVMKEMGIFNDELSDDMQEITRRCDAQRDSVLDFKDWKDSLQRLEDAWTNLTTEQYQEGVQTCIKVDKDIDKEFDKTFDYLYFSCFHEATNSFQNNKQEFIKHSWLQALKSQLKDRLWNIRQKFASWNIDQEEIKLYKGLVNSYFAMKKEIEIGATALQQMKDNNTSLKERFINTLCAAVKDLWNQTTAAIEKFCDWDVLGWWMMATGPLLVGWRAVKLLMGAENWKKLWRTWDILLNADMIHVGIRAWKQTRRRMPMSNLDWVPWLKWRYDIPHGDQLLLQDLIDWKISWQKATEILSVWNSKRVKLKDKKLWSVSGFMQIMFDKSDVAMPASHIDALFNSEVRFMRNETLRELVFWKEKTTYIQMTWWRLINWYCRKTYPYVDIKNASLIEKFMKWAPSSYQKLTKQQQELFAKIIEGWDFRDITNLENLTKNINQIQVNNLNAKQLNQLANELCTNMWELEYSNLSKIQKRIGNILAGAVEEIKPTAELLNNASYKQLNQSIEARLKTLRDLKDRPNISEWRLSKVEKEIEELTNFQRRINGASLWEIDDIRDIYNIFSKWDNFVENIDVITKLLAKNSDEINEALRTCDGNKLFNVVKRLKREWHFQSWAEAISENAIKRFKNVINNMKQVERFSGWWEAALKGLRTFVKTLAKLT